MLDRERLRLTKLQYWRSRISSATTERRGVGDARLDGRADQSRRHRVVVLVDLDVIVGRDLALLPFGVAVRLGRGARSLILPASATGRRRRHQGENRRDQDHGRDRVQRGKVGPDLIALALTTRLRFCVAPLGAFKLGDQPRCLDRRERSPDHILEDIEAEL